MPFADEIDWPAPHVWPGSDRAIQVHGVTLLITGEVPPWHPPSEEYVCWRAFMTVPSSHPWYDLRDSHPVLPPYWEWMPAPEALCIRLGRRDLAEHTKWLEMASSSQEYVEWQGTLAAGLLESAWPAQLHPQDLLPMLASADQEIREFARDLVALVQHHESDESRFAPIVEAWRVRVIKPVDLCGTLCPLDLDNTFEMLRDSEDVWFLRDTQSSLPGRCSAMPHDWIPVEKTRWDGWR